MIYILKEGTLENLHAGSKARLDCEKIIEKKANGSIYLSMHNKKDVIIKFPFQVIKIFASIKKSSVIVLQYPYYGPIEKIIGKIFKYIKAKKNLKYITVIHDLESLRLNKDNTKAEIEFLNMSDVIISHNSKMTEWIRNNNVDSEIIDLNIFDYLYKFNKDKVIKNNNKVIIAGNLDINKSGFVYELNNEKLLGEFELYGPNYKGSDREGIDYKGSYLPEKLIELINGGYGLIWDGDDFDKCSGVMGEYLKYNNPHKLSLYMACGIPVIVWNKSAISEFVKENNIGIVIESINDLPNVINNITEEEYRNMVNEVDKIRKNVCEGKYLENAFNSALNKIENY